jgi:hypothetical protein
VSRVEDDRDDARIAAQQAEKKRTEELSNKKKAESDQAFSKLVGAQKEQVRQQEKSANARSAIANLLAQSKSAQGEAKSFSEKAARGQLEAGQALGNDAALAKQGETKASHDGTAARGESRATETARQSDAENQGLTEASRSSEQGMGEGVLEGRKFDARSSREAIEERKESSTTPMSTGGGRASSEKGDLKADADKGGGQQKGGGGQDSKDGSAAPQFRLNPALMAPPPVAQKKDTSGSDRLRKIAAELAQKIVEQVRVGKNSAGRMEFQIDLKSDVLAGLSVKVSSHNGKIKATFTGSDAKVLKMLEEHREALKSALGARGLTLEDLKIEARR